VATPRSTSSVRTPGCSVSVPVGVVSASVSAGVVGVSVRTSRTGRAGVRTKGCSSRCPRVMPATANDGPRGMSATRSTALSGWALSQHQS
jgi:hypothetical protein